VVTNGERFSLTPGTNHEKNHNPHIIMTLKESVRATFCNEYVDTYIS
jgi:hypothetical protein